MTTKQSASAIDTIIAVLHPSTAPNVVNTGGALEFETNDELILPTQRRLKNELVRALSDFANRRHKSGFFVTSTLRIQPDDDVEFPATCVIRLAGASVTRADVGDFQAAAKLLLTALIPQKEIWDLPNESVLQSDDLTVLQTIAKDFSHQFAGRAIRQGVMIRIAGKQSETLTIQGAMPALTVQHSATQLISGTARPIGFDEEKNLIALDVSSVTDDTQLPIHKRVEVLCPTPAFLRILATAYANRNMLEFQALRQLDATNQKTILTMQSLKEVVLSPEAYELQ